MPNTSRRLYVTDRQTRVQFLIDTGADICVFPRRLTKRTCDAAPYKLYVANGTEINTYGTINLNLDLSLRRNSPWRFVIADVQKAIIGADFLAHYELLPDIRHRKLRDAKTSITPPGQLTTSNEATVSTINNSEKYHQIMSEFPEICKPATGMEQRTTCKKRQAKQYPADHADSHPTNYEYEFKTV